MSKNFASKIILVATKVPDKAELVSGVRQAPSATWAVASEVEECLAAPQRAPRRLAPSLRALWAASVLLRRRLALDPPVLARPLAPLRRLVHPQVEMRSAHLPDKLLPSERLRVEWERLVPRLAARLLLVLLLEVLLPLALLPAVLEPLGPPTTTPELVDLEALVALLVRVPPLPSEPLRLLAVPLVLPQRADWVVSAKRLVGHLDKHPPVAMPLEASVPRLRSQQPVASARWVARLEDLVAPL